MMRQEGFFLEQVTRLGDLDPSQVVQKAVEGVAILEAHH